jgi:PAB-dependent poly(A)-specific ribonuclease subunit 2
MDIQDEVHDSIEDAKTALALYRHYERVSAQGPAALNAVLQDLYNYGQRANWVIGSDRLR